MRFFAASSKVATIGNKTIPAAKITAMRRASTRDRVGSSLQAEAMAHHTTRRTRAIEIRKSGIGKRRCTHQWGGTARAAANSRSTTVPLGATTLTIGSSAANTQNIKVRSALGLLKVRVPAVSAPGLLEDGDMAVTGRCQARSDVWPTASMTSSTARLASGTRRRVVTACPHGALRLGSEAAPNSATVGQPTVAAM